MKVRRQIRCNDFRILCAYEKLSKAALAKATYEECSVSGLALVSLLVSVFDLRTAKEDHNLQAPQLGPTVQLHIQNARQ